MESHFRKENPFRNIPGSFFESEIQWSLEKMRYDGLTNDVARWIKDPRNALHWNLWKYKKMIYWVSRFNNFNDTKTGFILKKYLRKDTKQVSNM